jgi:malonate decarboxylase delta subunit
MTETFHLTFPASMPVLQRAHVGVVASGDMEVLLEPGSGEATVQVLTTVRGHRKIWEAVLGRFFARYPHAATIEINDHGATPGLVWLRLEQALELSLREPA